MAGTSDVSGALALIEKLQYFELTLGQDRLGCFERRSFQWRTRSDPSNRIEDPADRGVLGQRHRVRKFLDLALDLRRLYLRQRRLVGSTMLTPDDFVELARIANAGGVAPEVAESFPLVDLHLAQERFVAKDFTGKLVVTPTAPSSPA